MNTAPYWYPLFRLMHEQHGLTLLDGECNEIARAVDECRRSGRGFELTKETEKEAEILINKSRFKLLKKMKEQSRGRK